MSEKKQAEQSFEQAVARIEAIVRLLERGEAPLEQSLALFAEGSALLTRCAGQLDKAEQMVRALTAGEDGDPALVPFAAEHGE